MPTRVYRQVVINPLIEKQEDKSVLALDTVINGGDINNSIQTNFLTGLNSKTNKLYAYAEDNSAFGLPIATIYNNTVTDLTVIEDVLDVIEGEATNVLSSLIGIPNEEFFAHKLLTENYGYDLETNIVSAPPFTPTEPSTVTFVDANFVAGNLEIYYSVQDDALLNPPTTETSTEVLVDLVINDSYYMVEYTTVAIPATKLFWYYNPATSVYPSLDIIDIPLDLTQFMPVLVLRAGKHTLTEEDGNKYTSMVEALDIIDVDFDELIEGIHENPELDSIETVSVQYMVDIESKNPAVQLYLWQFFKDLSVYTSGNTFEIKGSQHPYGLTVHVVSPTFYYSMNASMYDEKIISGTFTDATNIVKNVTYTTSLNGPYAGQVFFISDVLYVRRKLTANTYSEIAVGNFSMTYYSGSNFVSDDRNRAVGGSLYDIGTEYYRPMHIPINKQTLNRFTNNPMYRSDILREGLSLFISTREIVEIEWYETLTFGFFINSLALVISIATLTPEIAAIALAATYYAAAQIVLTLVIKYYLIGIAVDYTLQFLVKEFGLENTFIAIAVAAVIAIITKSYDVLGEHVLPWADDLLLASTTLVDALGKPINDALSEIYKETGDFLETAKDRQEKIDEAQSLLGDGSIDPFDIIFQPTMVGFDETPDQYYERTIHNTNPGVASLSAIEHYVPNALRLPKT